MNKSDIDTYLEALSQSLLEQFGDECHVELVLVGGAVILLNHSFRESTMDIDAFSRGTHLLNSAIGEVAQKMELNTDWLNFNVRVTQSYTDKLAENATLYKVFNRVLVVRLANTVDLVCMKLVAYRPDSHDITDIEGLLESGNIKYSDIDKAMCYLYDDWSRVPIDAQLYIEKRLSGISPEIKEYVKTLIPKSSWANWEGTEDELIEQFYNRYFKED